MANNLFDTVKADWIKARKEASSSDTSKIVATLLGTIIGEVQTEEKYPANVFRTPDELLLSKLKAFKKKAKEILALPNITNIQHATSTFEIDIINRYLPLEQACQPADVEAIVEQLFNDNPDKVEAAKQKLALGNWFVGQTMKASGGKADPNFVRSLVESKLK